MDIFKFDSGSSNRFQQGQIIQGLTSKMWVERYRKEGEFKLVAPVSSGLRQLLPEGSFISHVDTAEIMEVENHEISETEDAEPDIIITGRSLESILEQRIVGSNRTWPTAVIPPAPYTLSAAYTWTQCLTLIEEYILASSLVDDDDAFDDIVPMSVVSGTGESVIRELKRDEVYSQLISIMEVDDLGIKRFL